MLPLVQPRGALEEELAWGPAFPELATSAEGWFGNEATVRWGKPERASECDAGELPLRKGDSIVVETERGPELALVLSSPRRRVAERRPALRVLRRAGEQDLALEARQRVREAEAARVAGELAHGLGLAVKVVRADAASGRMLVTLAAEERVELRELARQLGRRLAGRVELRVVGLRDAAKSLGGVGPCGLQLCCNTFLGDFAPVSIRMAKEQGLALNPQRISGVCGRLLCCLVYEDAFYRAQRSQFPRVGKRVQTPKGEGLVRDVDVLARQVRVSLGDGTMLTFALEELAGAPAASAAEDDKPLA